VNFCDLIMREIFSKNIVKNFLDKFKKIRIEKKSILIYFF
jgi:hypothetical protein